MPKNQSKRPHHRSKEMAFARLVLSGTITDRDAAEAAGLPNPDTAAYTKAKPRVRVYMLEYRKPCSNSSSTKNRTCPGVPRKTAPEGRAPRAVWSASGKLPRMSSEMTRGSITGQVKAISMIVAIEGLIPIAAPAPAANNSAPPLPPRGNPSCRGAWPPAGGNHRPLTKRLHSPGKKMNLASSDTETTAGSWGTHTSTHAPGSSLNPVSPPRPTL